MGNYINRQTVIDSDTGEILKDKTWLGYDGFNDKGYNYRRRAIHIKYYFDALPCNLKQDELMLLLMLAEIANNENVLVYRVDRKSKFSSIIYKPMDKEYIASHIRFHYGQNKFDRCWRALSKHCIKRIKYHEYMAWAINPAVVSKCREVPIWLYEEFQEYMNPYLSASAIKKFQNKIDSQYS